jgi:hypothetical protein
MLDFYQYLTEDRNTHLEHLEDDILNNGVSGGNNAINFLYSLKDMLQGRSRRKFNVTVKWDGAPAIFAGTNPDNGKFFVGTKSIFNKTPLINYTNADIDRNHPSGPNSKLKASLKYFKALGIPGIWQGDLLYTSDDLKTANVGGDDCVIFTPNTITYAVALNSVVGKTIQRSKIGVVWHTSYSGRTMATLKAKFGVNAQALTSSRKVWSTDATFKDTSGNVTFTAGEAKKFQGVLNMASGSLKKASSYLHLIEKDIKAKNLWTPAGIMKVFLNSYIRGGHKIQDTRKVTAFFEKYYEAKLDKKIASVRSPAGKKKWKEVKKNGILEYNKYKRDLYFVIASYISLQTAKTMVIQKLNRAENIGTFIKTSNGYRVTAPEGFVAIDRIGRALKLVDRLEFSKANFTVAKDWT